MDIRSSQFGGRFCANFLWVLLTFSFFSTSIVQGQVLPTRNKALPEMMWWYQKWATKYWEGLPIGTGRLAAMVEGKIRNDQMVLNDETLWSGSPYNPNNPKGPEILQEVRKLIMAGDYAQASEKALLLNSTPMSVQHYQPMGSLVIQFLNHAESEVKNYTRKLSMDSAVVTIQYQIGDVWFKREFFASYPDQIIVMRMTASKPKQLSVKAGLTSLQPSAATQLDQGDIVMRGTTTELDSGRYKGHKIPAAIKWQTRLRIVADGGYTLRKKYEAATGDRYEIDNADTLTFYIAGATNWNRWNDVSGNEKERCDQAFHRAVAMGYHRLKQRHLEDYMPSFAANQLDLGDHHLNKLPTDERMERLRKGETDRLFVTQYYQYARYLLLAAAREGTLPFNNHNIWLNNMEGRWQGRWTLNINIQECYWPVESTGLQKLNEPLLKFTQQLAEAGARTAKELYGCRGWVAHHGTDIWFNTAPTDRNMKATVWPMGGAWLLQQLFEHYQYEPNADYLKSLYPLMKGAVEFFTDFMVEDPTTGYLVTAPSTSPENNFYTADGKIATTSKSSAMDVQIIRNLFQNFLLAASTLQQDEGMRSQVETMLNKLPRHQVSKEGYLMEWLEDFKEAQPGHRHISHLFASYPDDQITLYHTPTLAKAVQEVLERRGDINKGWSGAWKINQHARLREPEKAWSILLSMLTDVSIHPREEDSKITPSFEGNQGIQGVASGVAEMLVQNLKGELVLLPSLPKAIPEGSVQGLRAKNNVTIHHLSWKNGSLDRAELQFGNAQVLKLRVFQPVQFLKNGRPVKGKKRKDGTIHLSLAAGDQLQIKGV